jgi:hypothetical protein
LIKDVFNDALFGFFFRNWKIWIFFKENSEILLKNGQKFEILQEHKHEITYSNLDYFEIRLRILLKISEIYLKNGQKNQVHLDRSWKAEIWRAYALLV